MFKNPDDGKTRDMLIKCKNIAVVGLSENPEKDSHQVARYLKENGYRIIPVNPAAKEILGEKAYPDLASIPDRVDIVNVFRRSEHLPAVVKESLRINPGCIWAQLGVSDEGSANEAAARGVTVVMDRCIKIEHKRLLKGNEKSCGQ